VRANGFEHGKPGERQACGSAVLVLAVFPRWDRARQGPQALLQPFCGVFRISVGQPVLWSLLALVSPVPPRQPPPQLLDVDVVAPNRDLAHSPPVAVSLVGLNNRLLAVGEIVQAAARHGAEVLLLLGRVDSGQPNAVLNVLVV
jgi:hypothetical protein